MTKEEAKTELRKAESDLRQANVILEMHEQRVQEIQEEIAKLEAIINKPDRWQDGLVQPGESAYFYISGHDRNGLDVVISSLKTARKPEHAFRNPDQAELIKEKMLLMQEMHAFAHVRNEGWMPDWGDGEKEKYGITSRGDDEIEVGRLGHINSFVFGVAVKSKEIAEEMLEIFGDRIEKFYNKMY